MEKFRDAAAVAIYLSIVYPDAILQIEYHEPIYIVEMIYHGLSFQFSTIDEAIKMQQFIHDSILRWENIH